MRQVLLVAALLAGGVVTASAQCAPVSSMLVLGWDASTSQDVDEVRLFFSPTPGGQDLVGAAHDRIPITDGVEWHYADGPALASGRYFIIAKAADIAGNMSADSSNELCIDLDQEGPSASPTNLRIIINVTLDVSVEVNGAPVAGNQEE